MVLRAWTVLMIVSACLLPLLCLPLGFLFRGIDPIRNLTRSSFVVENSLVFPIRVTPLGVSDSATRRTLPLLKDTPRYTPESQVTDIRIEPGKSRKIIFDWDTISFSDLLVRTEGWTKMVVADPTAFRSGNRPTQVERFVIGADTRFVEAPPDALAARPPKGSGASVCTSVGLLALPVFVIARRRVWKLQKTENVEPLTQPTGSPSP